MKSMMYYINREEEYLLNILAQHKELLKNLPSYIEGHEFDNIVIYATGSSSNAAHAARIYMQSILEVPITVTDPSMAANYDNHWNDTTLYIAISQGGHSYSTIKLVEEIQKNNYEVIVITSDMSSPIAQRANHIIDLGIGIEEMPYVTVGYSATIVILWLIALKICFNNGKLPIESYKNEIKKIEKTICLINNNTKVVKNWYEKHKNYFEHQKRFVIISYGASYGVAKEAETKLTETVGYPTHAHELEEYMHGPYLGLTKDDCIFLVDPNGILSNRMNKLRGFLDKHVKHTILISTGENLENPKDLKLDASSDENLQVLSLVIPFQILSYQLADYYGRDLTTSYYPDFDEITKSKI